MQQMNVIKIIAKNIHDIRIRKNISLQELSEKTNISIEEIKKLGSDQSSCIGIPVYIQFADALGVDLEEITIGILLVED